MSAAARRVLLPRDAGSNAFRRAREELSTTHDAHVHNAADGCPLPEPHGHVGAKPRRTAERLPLRAARARRLPRTVQAAHATMAEAAAAEPEPAAETTPQDMTVEVQRSQVLEETQPGHGSSARHIWPAASTTSVMCDAKNQRIRSEADMKLLANRIQHLQLAEERARKKIAETKSRTSEIMALKKRNLLFAEQRKRLKAERCPQLSQAWIWSLAHGALEPRTIFRRQVF